jgi:hypothetical protein
MPFSSEIGFLSIVNPDFVTVFIHCCPLLITLQPGSLSLFIVTVFIHCPYPCSLAEKRTLIGAVADNALASFVVIHAALKRSVRLARYAGRADLEARLGANYRVAMGFGLHVGWAIEGAIGECC